MTKTLTAQFSDGTIAKRRTEADYTHASRRQHSSQVRFHMSEWTARIAAGRYGEVVRTDLPVATPEESAEVWTVTYADGETRDVTVTVRKGPIPAGREARPDVPVTGARRKR